MDKVLTIEIAYGTADQQWLFYQQCPIGTSAAEILDQAALERSLPGFVWRDHAIGIFSRLITPETALLNDCRLEIYRALLFDPKQARLNRAEQNPLTRAKAKNTFKRPHH